MGDDANSTGWGVFAVAINIVMSLVIISLIISLARLSIKVIRAGFAFKRNNVAGKLVLPVLAIVMVVFATLILALAISWMVMLLRNGIFNLNPTGKGFEFNSWLKSNFEITKKSFFKFSDPTNGDSGNLLFAGIFVTSLIWATGGMVFAIISRILTKKNRPAPAANAN